PLGPQRPRGGHRHAHGLRAGRPGVDVGDVSRGLPGGPPGMTAAAWSLRCEACGRAYAGLDVRYRCECGGTLDVVQERPQPVAFGTFDARRASRADADRSGVWRFRELVLPIDPAQVVTRPEGNTNLYDVPAL